eukprot:5261947-Prymnesium_polylepis.1
MVAPEPTTPLARACGYSGLPIREDLYLHRVPIYLRSGIGGCEEYVFNTTIMLPTQVPSPFVDTPAAVFCASGKNTLRAAWSGATNVAVVIAYLLYLRWRTQHTARLFDQKRLTAADFAVMIKGLKKGVPYRELEAKLKKDIAKDFEQDQGILGMGGQIDHIALGIDNADEIRLMRRLAELRLAEHELERKELEQLGHNGGLSDGGGCKVGCKVTRSPREALAAETNK